MQVSERGDRCHGSPKLLNVWKSYTDCDNQHYYKPLKIKDYEKTVTH